MCFYTMPMQFLSHYNGQTPMISAETGRMRLSDVEDNHDNVSQEYAIGAGEH